MSQSIAKRYAQALFELADESYQIKKVVTDMELIHQCFLDSEEFRVFVRNPIIPYEKREEALKSLFGKKIEEVTLEFLKLLAQKDRLEFLDLIAQEFKVLVRQAQGIVQAEVVAADKLTDDQAKTIESRLKKHLGKDVELATSVDEDMIGGLKIKIEDQIFDYSLDHQLKSFKSKVLKG